MLCDATAPGAPGRRSLQMSNAQGCPKVPNAGRHGLSGAECAPYPETRSQGIKE